MLLRVKGETDRDRSIFSWLNTSQFQCRCCKGLRGWWARASVRAAPDNCLAPYSRAESEVKKARNAGKLSHMGYIWYLPLSAALK